MIRKSKNKKKGKKKFRYKLQTEHKKSYHDICSREKRAYY